MASSENAPPKSKDVAKGKQPMFSEEPVATSQHNFCQHQRVEGDSYKGRVPEEQESAQKSQEGKPRLELDLREDLFTVFKYNAQPEIGTSSGEEARPWIQKVPQILRENERNKNNYDPRLVSIGPYHYGNPKLELGKSLIKNKLVKQFKSNVEKNSNKSLEDYFKSSHFSMVAKEARDCYAAYADGPSILYDDEAFKCLMFLDGCFVVYFIYCSVNNKCKDVGMKSDYEAIITMDLFLLENQLPYIVLQALQTKFMPEDRADDIKKFVKMQTGAEGSRARRKGLYQHFLDISVGDCLCCKCCTNSSSCSAMSTDPPTGPVHSATPEVPSEQPSMSLAHPAAHEVPSEQPLMSLVHLITHKVPSKQPPMSPAHPAVHGLPAQVTPQQLPMSPIQPLHLLDLLRTEFLVAKSPVDEPQQTDEDGAEWLSFRSVVELKTVGINCLSSGSSSVNSIKFKPYKICTYGRLFLPAIIIDDSFKTMWLNLAAYEACPDFFNDGDITSFICFIDSLIDHPEDVKELREQGVLLNFLGSDQHVAELFNELATDLVPNPVKYRRVACDIQKHFDNTCAVWIAEFLHTHFGSPWTVLASGAVALALLFTALGLIFTIIQTFKKN